MSRGASCTFWVRVRCESRLPDWNVTPMDRARTWALTCALILDRSCPSTRMVPSSATSRLARHDSRVDFPEFVGPVTAISWPGASCTDTERSEPEPERNRRETPRASSTGFGQIRLGPGTRVMVSLATNVLLGAAIADRLLVRLCGARCVGGGAEVV